MKLLTITSLYPNHVENNWGVFIETRLKYLIEKYPEIEHTVIAPVPWFPSKNDKYGQYAKFAQVSSEEVRGNIKVYHPKYIVIPKVGMLFTPFFMAFSIWNLLRRLKKKKITFDIIDGHYYYPDGVAIALIAKRFSLPFTVTARGTDLNLIPQYFIPRKLIQWTAKRAAHCITVCAALKDVLLELGVESEHVTVMRNGVNLTRFSPSPDREKLRESLKMTRTTLVSAGYLIERKGHHFIIEALPSLSDIDLVIVGDGPWKGKLESLAQQLGVSDRVRFTGAIKQEKLAEYFQAGDIGMLASSREGWANVLLESMACGTPVVATKVWGTPEVVSAPEAGELVERNANDIARGVRQLLDNKIDRQATRKYAEQFNWDETSEKQHTLFTRLLSK